MMKQPAAAALFATFVITAALYAQQAPPTDLTEAMLTAYTKAHLDLNSARDDYHRALGGTHDLGERERLRTELAERTGSLLSENGLSADDYGRITTLISVQEPLRVRFEALLAELSGGDFSLPSARLSDSVGAWTNYGRTGSAKANPRTPPRKN